MDARKLSTIAVSNSAGCFLFSVLVPVPVIAIITGTLSIVTASMSLAAHGPRAKNIVSIVLSAVWLVLLAVLIAIRVHAALANPYRY